ncbi:MAG TPA: BPL-N domain-containing protein [Candidatus Limnocylindria bacterium]|nr:BPL-N domain-containing protein [Candidatus Limnocylindria bacterium]
MLSVLVGLTGCSPAEPDPAAPILLFKGTGTSPNDVKAVEAVLKDAQLAYATVNSEQLDHLSEARLRAYRLFIIPGGNYLTMGDGLTTSATAKVREAVQQGVNYLGICAGGLLAGQTGRNSMNLTAGVKFGFYAVVNRGLHKGVVAVAGPGSPALEQYWEDGPQFTGWGAVVGKYPDGTPAVVQGTSGKGWVVLCGVHPEAPEHWRRGMNFTTPAGEDHAYARRLIEAALNATPLPQY